MSYLTKEGLEELKTDLEKLKKEARADIAERLRRAKEYGDLSENSEYIDAKDAQAKVESRIFELEEMIRTAILIKKEKSKEVVSVGSTLEVKKDGKTLKYTIVGSEEANPAVNLISNESPLGRAFIGKRTGDTIEVDTPGGKVKYKITKIE
ncbi:transcription elongation factor GreA [Candidatus Wolfebacteria bacterium]|nr:transcription elongation factor GreA [Candidatus Wolfebacteria bacterium]